MWMFSCGKMPLFFFFFANIFTTAKLSVEIKIWHVFNYFTWLGGDLCKAWQASHAFQNKTYIWHFINYKEVFQNTLASVWSDLWVKAWMPKTGMNVTSDPRLTVYLKRHCRWEIWSRRNPEQSKRKAISWVRSHSPFFHSADKSYLKPVWEIIFHLTFGFWALHFSSSCLSSLFNFVTSDDLLLLVGFDFLTACPVQATPSSELTVKSQKVSNKV